MPVVSPSSVGSPAVGQGPAAAASADADAGAQLTENFMRRMQGMNELEGVELDRFNRRREAENTRQAQLADIEQGLADRSIQAEEMEQTLRSSGLADVAERFRRATRTQGFNAARRGLQGGSADIQQQAATEAGAGAQAEQVASDAARQRINMEMQAARQAAGLEGMAQGMDPFERMLLGQEQQGLGDQNMVQGGIASANRTIEQGNNLRRGAVGAGLGSFLTGTGNAGMSALIGGA